MKHWLRQKAVRLAIAFLLAASAEAHACQFDAEGDIVAALMDLQTTEAISRARSLGNGEALIPSSEFYVALANWYRAYQQSDTPGKSAAISLLRDALAALERSARVKPGLDSLLAAGIAGGHIARILFDNEQYLAGYRIAQRARKRLEQFLRTAQPDHPGMPDARLLEGLFELYSYDLRQRATWLPRSFSYKGNRDRGIRLVERAISDGAVFGSEAIRALLGEVSWRTPDFCRYIKAIDQAGTRLPDNRDIAVLRQGLLLKCGLPQRAKTVNRQYLLRHQGNPLWEFLRRARWRIYASLGAIDDITSTSPEQSNFGHYRLALANAYDVANRRHDALRLYRELATAAGLEAAIKSVATVRIQYAFHAPREVRVSQLEAASGDTCPMR